MVKEGCGCFREPCVFFACRPECEGDNRDKELNPFLWMQSVGTVGTGPAPRFLQPEGPRWSDSRGGGSTLGKGLLLPRRSRRHVFKVMRAWIYFLLLLLLLPNTQILHVHFTTIILQLHFKPITGFAQAKHLKPSSFALRMNHDWSNVTNLEDGTITCNTGPLK